MSSLNLNALSKPLSFRAVREPQRRRNEAERAEPRNARGDRSDRGDRHQRMARRDAAAVADALMELRSLGGRGVHLALR